jgi:hypothetical protein
MYAEAVEYSQPKVRLRLYPESRSYTVSQSFKQSRP